jgi:hypothetical protein
MMIAMIARFVLTVIMVIGILMTFVSISATVAGLVLAAKHRRLGTSLLSAIASRNVMFKPQLYEEEAIRWARLHRWGFVATAIFIAISGVASLCLKAFE